MEKFSWTRHSLYCSALCVCHTVQVCGDEDGPTAAAQTPSKNPIQQNGGGGGYSNSAFETDVLETRDLKVQYNAASPDEKALGIILILII